MVRGIQVHALLEGLCLERRSVVPLDRVVLYLLLDHLLMAILALVAAILRVVTGQLLIHVHVALVDRAGLSVPPDVLLANLLL